MDTLASRVHRLHTVVIGAGRPATRACEIDRTLREAQHVVQSLRAGATDRSVHRLEDVHLRGLFAMLVDDDRLRMFVHRELDLLRAHDHEWGNGLEDALQALPDHPTSKSKAAAGLHVSRPVFYDRLSRVERLLDVDLDDPEIRLSLHAALVADDVARHGR